MQGIIYCYRNKINDKKYIGQTIRPNVRKSRHLANALNGMITKFYTALRKYGIEGFEYVVLEIVESDTKEGLHSELNLKEAHYISLHNSFKSGYNMNVGGDAPMRGATHTEEFKLKASERNKGENNPHYGKKRSSSSIALTKQYQLEHNAKPVIRLSKAGEYIDEFESLEAAAKAVNGDPTNIGNVCKGKPKYITAYKYKWEFKQQ
jgi:group I intron endonuclease